MLIWVKSCWCKYRNKEWNFYSFWRSLYYNNLSYFQLYLTIKCLYFSFSFQNQVDSDTLFIVLLVSSRCPSCQTVNQVYFLSYAAIRWYTSTTVAIGKPYRLNCLLQDLKICGQNMPRWNWYFEKSNHLERWFWWRQPIREFIAKSFWNCVHFVQLCFVATGLKGNIIK